MYTIEVTDRQLEILIHSTELYARIYYKFPQSNIAWDLYQILRYKYSWDKYPEGGYTVNFNPPIKMGQEPLAKITKNEQNN